MSGKRVGMRDVAAASGVSPATVSFVMNNTANQTISPATRERVQQAARELGYVPHGIARALREGTSRIVLLNLDSVASSGSLVSYVRGLDSELALHGYVLLVRYGQGTDQSLQSIHNVVSPRATIDLTGLYEPGTETERDGGWEYGLAAHTAVQIGFLVDAGHRHIAVASPGAGDRGTIARARLRFAQQFAHSRGIGELAHLEVPRDPDDRARTIDAFRRAHPAVTAVAAFNDAVALALLSGLREVGVSVPTDIAVMGFDDTEFGAVSAPRLTSVHINAEGFGRLAARDALGLSRGDDAPAPATVIVRESA
jgi:DNA-binding LacI/PurR family transcriptional regulator